MAMTMFDTPVIKTIFRLLSVLTLKLSGWKVQGHLPATGKCVMIAAPHTSNWDLVYMLMVSFALKRPIYWLGKEQIFKFPFKSFMKWAGGIPVDRSQSTNMVDYAVKVFQSVDNMVLTVPPEGTRSKVVYWRTGFYHIAHQAGVPIYLGFLDYKKKIGGIGPKVITSGNIEEDMVEIKKFYQDVQGRHPSKHIKDIH